MSDKLNEQALTALKIAFSYMPNAIEEIGRAHV